MRSSGAPCLQLFDHTGLTIRSEGLTINGDLLHGLGALSELLLLSYSFSDGLTVDRDAVGELVHGSQGGLDAS